MADCPNCGTSGQANRDCATTSTDILWGGGGLCTGISGGTLDDVIRQLANAICGISSSLATLGAADTDVTVSGQIVGTCYGAHTYLNTWISETETLLCGLITTVAALDFSEPLYYNGTPTVTALSAVPVTTDTYTVAANTLDSTTEYLKLELYASVPISTTGTAIVSVNFMGATVNFTFTSGLPVIVSRRIEMYIVRSGNTTMQYDWREDYQRGKGLTYSNYSAGTTVSPVDWTTSNNLVIQAYNTSNSITVSKVRLTKIVKH